MRMDQMQGRPTQATRLGLSRRHDAADDSLSSQPEGTGVFCRMPASLGLDDLLKVVVGLALWPATKSAPSRPLKFSDRL